LDAGVHLLGQYLHRRRAGREIVGPPAAQGSLVVLIEIERQELIHHRFVHAVALVDGEFDLHEACSRTLILPRARTMRRVRSSMNVPIASFRSTAKSSSPVVPTL